MLNHSVEVTFGPEAPGSPEIQWLVRRIPGSGVGSWPATTDHVEVVRVLGGGRSGGTVLLADRYEARHRTRCVVKIDRTGDLHREWQAYQSHVKTLVSGLFAPVIAATSDVVTGTSPNETGALVYGEAADYTGQPGDAVRTLGELVAAAHADSNRLPTALALLDRTLRGAAAALHRNHKLHPGVRSLRSLNPGLGPSLTLDLDDGAAPWHPDDVVLRRTLGGLDTDLQPGDRVELRGLTQDGAFLGGQDIKIGYRGELGEPGVVRGTVLTTRGAERRRLVLDSVCPDEVAGDGWHVGADVFADPFAGLPQVLTEDSADRVYSAAHGDLNVGNVVVVGDHPCFIDYAHTTGEAPQQGDYAWLEISFLRDVFADAALPHLLKVQRALAVASNLLQRGATTDEARDLGLDLLTGAGTTEFEVLFAIRARAHGCYPHDDAGPEWVHDHRSHLLLAGHRSLKWSGAVQSPAKVRAVVAAAAVATEWLTEPSPFAHWPTADRERAVAGLRPRIVSALGSHRDQVLAGYRRDHETFIDLLVEDASTPDTPRNAVDAVLRTTVSVLTGGLGSGKTSLLREIAHRTAAGGHRIPVLLAAGNLGSPLLTAETLSTAAVLLLVDDLDDAPDRPAAVAELQRIHTAHPHLPIVVAGREDHGLPFPEFRLKEFDEAAIGAFLYRHAPPEAVPVLLHSLLDDPVWAPLDLRRPRSLAMLLGHIRSGALPARPHSLHERRLRKELGDDGFAAATRIAAGLLDGGVAEQDACHAAMSFFRRDGDSGSRLADRSDRDFLAAYALQSRPGTEQVSKAARPVWHHALCLFAGLPTTSPEIVRRIIGELSGEPVRAGELLRAAHYAPAELVAHFVQTQQELLRAELRPEGLQAFGDPEALAEVVRDRAARPDARATALATLEWLTDRARPGFEHRSARAALTDSTLAVLAGPADPALRLAALRAVCRFRLRGLELHIAAQLSEPDSWEVVRRAAEALRELGVALPEPERAAYHNAVEHRLNAVVEELGATTDVGHARHLRHERLYLLETLAPHPSAKEILLRHRFAFDVSGVAALLDPHVPGTAVPDPDTWLGQIGHGSPAEAAEAAHRLLRDAPGRSSEILPAVAGNAQNHHLMIAAAVVNEENIEDAERLFSAVLDAPGSPPFEGMSALVVALFRTDRARGVRLAWTATRSFAARELPERLRWPWKLALARCRGGLADLDRLLRGDETDVVLGIEALASWDVLDSGKAGPGDLPAPAQAALWAARPQRGAPPREIDSWARAVVTARMRTAVPHLRELAAAAGDTALTLSSNAGTVERPLSEILRAAIAELPPATESAAPEGEPRATT
ncbi:hypothetical protein [Amycolatopsis sp. NPDC058986]|uniref:hypothetical protein n=1 Tax=unclassified Amycolatopsis TaxID=2618356 RepID=UPI003670E4AA